MFVSIDMDNLRILHKHPDHETLSALAWLEAPGVSVMIENTERPNFLAKLRSLDLRILYKHTTALDITGTGQLVVMEMLATLIEEKLTAKPAVLDELLAQIAVVEDDLYKGIGWKYAKGSRRPAKQEQLFALHCGPLAFDEAKAAATRAPQRRALQPAPLPPAAVASAPAPAQQLKQRMSNVRAVIWAAADKLWEAEGKPMDKAVVLELRKRMMTVLEEEGVKRTSSSNELGNWMKARLA
jgi:hypothetical protein